MFDPCSDGLNRGIETLNLAVRPVVLHGGICGSTRVWPAIPVRDECGMTRNPRSVASMMTEKIEICREFTGATGLEPATSGATGRIRPRGLTRANRGFGVRAGLFLRRRSGIAGTSRGFRRPPAGCARDRPRPRAGTRRRRDGTVCGRGGDEERIRLRVDLDAAVSRERLASARRCSASASAYPAGPSSCSRFVEPSMSVKRNLTPPRRRSRRTSG
jgi:hypothetical protein